MKIRNGFVSNSSSSSFVIIQSMLTDKQKEMLINHIDIAKKIDDELVEKGENKRYEWYEEWFIEEDGFVFWCHTSMDNFDLEGFLLLEANVDEDNIIRMGDGWYNKPLFEEEYYKKFKMQIRKEKLNKIKNNEKFN